MLIPKEKMYKDIANFIYETGIHSKTPRSGLWFLGSGSQSVAEHLFHTAIITYALCFLEPKADKQKSVLMALFHDIGEGRTSDLNYVHQRYGRPAEAAAVADIAKGVPFGKEIAELFDEEQAKETLEAKIVKDADNLEWIATLRNEEVKGNLRAEEWIKLSLKRLITVPGKQLGKYLVKNHPDDWWFEGDRAWFIDRNRGKK